MISLMIVDDHATVRAGLATLLELEADISVVAQASDGAQAVDLVGMYRPEVVLMDLSMPVMSGADATREIMNRWPDTRVIGLTSFSEQEWVITMLDAGACGYLLKEDEPIDLIRGIRVAVDGQSPLAPRAAAALLRSRVDRSPLGILSDREREVLSLLADGLTNSRIAATLNIREATVKAHLTRVYQVLGVPDRTSAALRARELGLRAIDSGG
jgi:DNA-binding NarL/FixJ family response regulator